MPAKVFKGKAGVARSLDALLRGKVILDPKIKSLEVTYYRDYPKQTGTKIFLFEHIPQIKYHNPDLVVTMTHSKKLSTGLRLTMEGQKTPIEIATKGWSAKTIMNTLIKKTNAKDERTPAPPKLPWYKAESLPSSRTPVVKKVLVESKAAAAE